MYGIKKFFVNYNCFEQCFLAFCSNGVGEFLVVFWVGLSVYGVSRREVKQRDLDGAVGHFVNLCVPLACVGRDLAFRVDCAHGP